jgi:Mn-dependent DtxR family transcriptional regulator
MDDDNIITTPLDKLLDLVMKRGRIRIKDAAKSFGVSRAQIDEWAKILEEHGLVEIHYPPVGEPELRKKQPVKEKKGR